MDALAADIGVEAIEFAHPFQSKEELVAQLRASAEGEEDGASDDGGGGVEGGGFGEREERLDVGVGALEGGVLEIEVSRRRFVRELLGGWEGIRLQIFYLRARRGGAVECGHKSRGSGWWDRRSG